jgi:alpha-beta hydrolase superfamily lysophospholipase
MIKKTDFFETNDGVKIAFSCWLPEEAPRAVLQIAHGMAEYAERYEHFAGFLCENGIAVYANDHRGHGKTAADPEKLGYFADKNGWIKVVTDMRNLTKIIQLDYPDTPVFLMGHSMGSFLARTYITLYDDIQGVILSGTGAHPRPLIKSARLLAYLLVRTKGAKSASPFFDNMIMAPLNKEFEAEGKNAWLTRKKPVVEAYNKDPYCGFVCTNGFFKDFFYGLDYISNKEHNQWIRFTLPIHIISGEKDPVGDFGKGPEKVADMYRRLQIEDVTLKLYKEARHELINELNRDAVYGDILEWLNYHK